MTSKQNLVLVEGPGLQESNLRAAARATDQQLVRNLLAVTSMAV